MQQIGKYEIVGELGRGGMGTVYRGRDAIIGRDVAIKVIQERALNVPEIKKRFYREARSAGRLSHENIMVIYDVGEENGMPYIVMEYLEGDDLRHILDQRTPLSLADKLSIAEQICMGLHYAHEHHIVHRDVKPENIRVLPNGRIKIMDFGIARIQSETQGLTRTNMSLGTPHYMAPEQITGEGVDHRADIFSFGVLLYELLTGAKPFAGDHVTTVIYKILNTEPPPLKIGSGVLSEELQKVVSGCLTKKRDARYQDFAAVLHDLQPIARQPDDTLVLSTAETLAQVRPPEATEEATELIPAAPPPPAPEVSRRPVSPPLPSPPSSSPSPPSSSPPRPAARPSAAPERAPRPAPEDEQKAGSSKKVLLAVLGVLLFVAVAAGGYFAFGPTEEAPVPVAGSQENAGPEATDRGDASGDGASLPETAGSRPSQAAGPAPAGTAGQEGGAKESTREPAAGRDEGRTGGAVQPEATGGDRSTATPREAGGNTGGAVEERNPTTTPEILDLQASSSNPVQADADRARTAMETAKRSVGADLRNSPTYQRALSVENRGTQAYGGRAFNLAVQRFQEAEALFKEAAAGTASGDANTEAVQAVVDQMTQDLKSFIEAEDNLGMQAMFYRGWDTFFKNADGITAVVRPGRVQVAGNTATTDVRIQLKYRDEKSQSQETDTSYLWTLQYRAGEWMLTKVTAR